MCGTQPLPSEGDRQWDTGEQRRILSGTDLGNPSFVAP